MIRYCALFGVAVLLTGCSSTGFERFGGGRADSLTPAPTAPVQSGQLTPLDGSDPYGTQTYPTYNSQGRQPINNAMGAEAELASPIQNGSGVGVVAQAAPSNALDLKRTDLLGSWTLNSGAMQCKLNVNLTNWTGGYRASSRGCADADLQRINAWRLEGNKQVAFLAEDGVTVIARFYSGVAGRFDGQAVQDGRVLSFFR